jgi:AraC family transcriptional regulator, dual regulator of chb operon
MIMRLLATDYIDADIEGHYAFYPQIEYVSTQAHHHDFYEVFLIASGQTVHHINGTSLILNSGTFVFIRPDDKHYYSKHTNQPCELINLAFLSRTFEALADYIGLTNDDALLTAPMPPMSLLSVAEQNRLIAQFSEWGHLMLRDKARSRVALRALLAQVISQFFITRVDDYADDVPQWLVDVCQQMQHKEHIVGGRDALMQLANRTPEYVGRSFQQYLRITPSQFINNLRLDYASDLLLHTDDPVIDICYDVGFGNLSHFYHLFKARWDCSPKAFRKTNRRTLIP